MPYFSVDTSVTIQSLIISPEKRIFSHFGVASEVLSAESGDYFFYPGWRHGQMAQALTAELENSV
jgi:hypothetical protein